GESGTGKELVARALHFNSQRQHGPFIPINCSALPENLLESELFGHRRGAFTGAINDKKGLFQEADGGTIFLDEVGSMSPLLQSRLLRVLQEREVRRVGDNLPVYVNVRVLAATNEPLEQRIKEGTFREDLYYRLNVIAIPLPPLRDRLDDIPLLVAHFLQNKGSARNDRQFKLTRPAMDALCAYDWPGNVRELENAIERAVTLCECELVRLRDLPPSLLKKLNIAPTGNELEEPASLPNLPESPNHGAKVQTSHTETATHDGSNGSESHSATSLKPLKHFLRDQEIVYLSRTLDKCSGDKEKAASLLGVSLATLYRKLSGDEREG
ncbi:MAG: sigma 54-interacting transcriptional regulator, partial [Akkermansiaceae bacterium]|nr:sigma 54-interacting transcriptional regulator [Verrucomicrobiales bacterium]